MRRKNDDEIRKKGHNKKRVSGRKKNKDRWMNVLTIIMIIILLILIGIYAVINHYYGKSNYVSDNEFGLLNDDSVETESIGLTDDELNALQSEILGETGDIELPNNSNVYNLLLIGVDRRDKSWYGNSDSMILISINKETQKIHMTSFMRDLYANIPEVGVRKLNASCAYGGGPLVVRTIEDNYKIPIDNYASVDFEAMIDIVDLVGGVDIELSDAEAKLLNSYADAMCESSHEDSSAHHILSGGMHHLDGYQAVAYARIRYVGNADYERTERQRKVLSKIIENVKSLNVAELNTLVEGVLPKVTHNIDQSRLMTLIGDAPTILSYEIVQSRVPYDDLYSFQGEMLVPNFSATIQRLQTDIYGDSTVEQ